MRRLVGLLFVGVLVSFGCAASERGKDKERARSPAGMEAHQDKKAPAGQAEKKQAIQRKIIYTVRIEMGVEDFDKTRDRMLALVKEYDGYLANEVETGKVGESRNGQWTLRIPVARFDEFVTTLVALGELHRKTRDSDDVTDRYHDTKAELLNLEARQQALREMYKQAIKDQKSEHNKKK